MKEKKTKLIYFDVISSFSVINMYQKIPTKTTKPKAINFALWMYKMPAERDFTLPIRFVSSIDAKIICQALIHSATDLYSGFRNTAPILSPIWNKWTQFTLQNSEIHLLHEQ